MQILVPLVMTIALFGSMGGDSLALQSTSGTLIGKIPAGTQTWIQNAGFVWMLWLVPLAFATWFGMNNIDDEHVSPNVGSPFVAFAKILFMLSIGLLTAAFGLWLLLIQHLDKFIVLPIVIVMTVILLKLIPGAIGQNLTRQYQIFKNKHTWVMTVIYTMTFGSFIGYAAGFGLAIKVIFGFKHVVVDGVMTHNLANPDGPSALMYAWTGPFIGALIRPIGGMIADKVGGARVTQWVSIVMIGSALGVAYYMQQAYSSATPQDYFVPFLILFLLLFTATGIGNGSTFKTIATIFNKEQAGPVLGWTSAIAAYGAFLIPKILGEQIKATTPQYALYGFAIFYAVCLVLNWFYYMRKGGEYHNP
jgi:NNP family nitrate/nitrite transporter-like MFS transporter